MRTPSPILAFPFPNERESTAAAKYLLTDRPFCRRKRGGNHMARVLVIDDEVDDREAVQEMLESAGHEVILAAGGREGLAKYRQDPVDLILIDLFMPEPDGFETMHLLRQEFPDVRIVAMSG